MSTIAPMTSDAEADVAPDGTATADQTAAVHPTVASVDRDRRSVMVPLLATVVTALIAGVFGFAVVGFNTLRDDIVSLRADLSAEIDGVRADLSAKISSEISSVRADLGGEIDSLRADLGGEIDSLRADLGGEIDSLRADMRAEISSVRADLGAEIDSLRDDIKALDAKFDERFEQVNTTLLDHAERLSRIEAILDVSPESSAES